MVHFTLERKLKSEAKKLGFGYLLRYEHLLGENEEIEEVRCIFVELPGAAPVGVEAIPVRCIRAAPPAANQPRTIKAGRPRCGPISTSSNTRAIGCAFSSTPAARD